MGNDTTTAMANETKVPGLDDKVNGTTTDQTDEQTEADVSLVVKHRQKGHSHREGIESAPNHDFADLRLYDIASSLQGIFLSLKITFN